MSSVRAAAKGVRERRELLLPHSRGLASGTRAAPAEQAGGEDDEEERKNTGDGRQEQAQDRHPARDRQLAQSNTRSAASRNASTA